MSEVKKEKKPISKKAIIITAISVAIVVVEVIAVYFSYIKPEHEKAIASYSKTLQEYNVMLSNYDAMCEKFQSENSVYYHYFLYRTIFSQFSGKPISFNICSRVR